MGCMCVVYFVYIYICSRIFSYRRGPRTALPWSTAEGSFRLSRRPNAAEWAAQGALADAQPDLFYSCTAVAILIPGGRHLREIGAQGYEKLVEALESICPGKYNELHMNYI